VFTFARPVTAAEEALRGRGADDLWRVRWRVNQPPVVERDL